MQIVTFVFFAATLLMSLAVISQMLVGSRHRILDALAGGARQADLGLPAEVIYLRPQQSYDVEWRKAA